MIEAVIAITVPVAICFHIAASYLLTYSGDDRAVSWSE